MILIDRRHSTRPTQKKYFKKLLKKKVKSEVKCATFEEDQKKSIKYRKISEKHKRSK